MKTTKRWVWTLGAWLVLLAGCTGHGRAQPYIVSRATGRAPMLIATGCAPLPEPAPDFTFNPASHPPRSHASRVVHPPLDSLPRLAQNLGCTPPGRAMETLARVGPPPPPPVVASHTKGRRGPTATRPGGQPKDGGSVAKSTPPPPAKKAPAAPAAGQAPPAPTVASRPPPADMANSQPAAPGMASGAEAKADLRLESAPPSAQRSGDSDDKSPSTATEKERPLSMEPFVPPQECPVPPPPEPPDATDQYKDYGVATYLSNDDSMSLSSAQRILFAIDKFLPLPPQHLRRHELLNYFSFETTPVKQGDDFSVQASLAPKPGEPNVFTLALAVQGRRVERDSRRNLSLTVVIDRSGSMRDEGRMTYLKRGLHRMVRELKPGDLINLVTFNTVACVPLANFVVGRDPAETLDKAIDGIQPQGNTDLHAGLLRGYQLADAGYRPGYNHRVLLITDAEANSGETNPELMSVVSRYYDRRQIRLSGIGVGRTFNDRLLNRLTERGKGAYIFLGSEAEVDAAFGRRFVSLVETIALDTHFLLHLPPSLRMNVFYGEESSTQRSEVQAVHFFASTSQLFLADVMAHHGKLRDGDMIMLTVDYQDPENGRKLVEEHAVRLGDIPKEHRNVKKGRMVVEFVDGLQWMASRVPVNNRASAARHGWVDDDAAWECDRRGRHLAELARGLEGDAEVQRVNGLWARYCERYETPRGPRPDEPRGGESWPGAATPPR